MSEVRKEYKLNIFELLSAIQNGNKTYYKKLTEEEKKGFVPHIVMRWLSGNYNPKRIFAINRLLNVVVAGPGDIKRHYIKSDANGINHNELFYYLMVSSMDGKVTSSTWSKQKSSKSNNISIDLISKYFKCSKREAVDYVSIFTNEQMIEFAEQLGWQKDEIKLLEKEIKVR